MDSQITEQTVVNDAAEYYREENIATCKSRGLTDADIAKHQALGISPAMLAAMCVERKNDAEARELMGRRRDEAGNFTGIWYPYRSPLTGDVWTGRLRLDIPQTISGHEAEYL